MGWHDWFERQRDRVLKLRGARQESDPIARMIHGGDSAGLAEAFLHKAETDGLLRDFRQQHRNLLIEHQGALACALGTSILGNPHPHESDDSRTWETGWRQEHENRSRTRRLTPAKSRPRSNSLER